MASVGFNANAYAGRWYEIAKYPTELEEGYQFVTADYAPTLKGLQVVNIAMKGDKTTRQIIGFATKTKVANEFSLSFATEVTRGQRKAISTPESTYKILWTDYTNITIVANSVGKTCDFSQSLWILSRQPKINYKTLSSALSIAEKLGYNIKQISVNMDMLL